MGGIQLTGVMEGKRRKKGREHEDTVGNGRNSCVVGAEGVLSEVGAGVGSQSKGLKKRKRSKHVEGDGEDAQEIMTLKKKVRSHEQSEVVHGSNDDRTKYHLVFDGKVDTSELESTPLRKKKGKKSCRETEHDVEGYLRDSEGDTAREQRLIPYESDVEVHKVMKKKRIKNCRDGKVGVHRKNDGLDVDEVNIRDEVDHVESPPVKKKGGKKFFGNNETETGLLGLGSTSNSNGGVKDNAVIQKDVDDYYEEALPTKKEGKKSRRIRGVTREGSNDKGCLDGGEDGDQAVVEDEVDRSYTQLLRTKKKEGKRKRREREVEEEVVGFHSNIGTDGDRMTDQAVEVNNEYRLEESPVRKKKGEKGRRAKGTGQEGQIVTINSDKKKTHSDVAHNEGSVLAKKIKKTVRFQEPETHWREQAEDDEHQGEEDVELEHYGSEDEDNSAVVGDDDVFSDSYLTGERSWKADLLRMDLKYGFFTKEENEKLKTAVYDFIKAKKWERTRGIDMLLHPRSHPETRGAWIEIAKCLPHRPVKQIHLRAQRLLSDLKRGTWSQEEMEQLKELYSQHGHDWKTIESKMGRPAQLIKDKWRVLRLAPILKKGKWNEEEFDQLCMYVRWSLKLKERLGKKERDNRILRDDINWEVIGEKMGRTSASCSVVWYDRLASSLIGDGCWANGDDRRLLRSLMESGASSEEAVDWDELLDDRDGLTCERRWYQMIRLLPEPRAPFEDKLEQLIRRYAPDLIGIEEDFGLVMPAAKQFPC